jgi:hypothetical protein
VSRSWNWTSEGGNLRFSDSRGVLRGFAVGRFLVSWFHRISAFWARPSTVFVCWLPDFEPDPGASHSSVYLSLKSYVRLDGYVTESLEVIVN